MKTDPHQAQQMQNQGVGDNHERHVDGKIHVNGEIEMTLAKVLVDKHEIERGEDAEHEKKKFRVDKVTLGFVIIVALLNVWQSYSAQRTADSMVIDQRPYVVVRLSGKPQQVVPDADLQQEVTITNVGRTPGVRLLETTELVYFPPANLAGADPNQYAMKFQSDFIDTQFNAIHDAMNSGRSMIESLKAQNDLAPGGDFQAVNNQGFKLTKAQIDDVESNNMAGGALFLMGRITYTDNSNPSRLPYETEFCRWLVGGDTNTWHRCRFHNVIR